ncbi:MAG: EAL domain-containing protein [Kiloniellaceae bacterium]
MQALLNLFLFALYAGLAVATAQYAPRFVPALDQTLAYGLGGLVLLGGGLLHEIHGRVRDGALTRARLMTAARATAEQDEELSWLRREVAGLREALEARGQGGENGRHGHQIDEIVAEVKVLKSLITRLSERAGAGAVETAPVPVGPGAARHPSPAVDLATVPGDADSELDLVREALRNDRIDLVIQPVVSLPQRKRRFYECYSRLRTADGSVILPDRYIAVAEGAGLITAIDNMLLFRCVQLVRLIHRRNQDVDFFCNISPYSLVDAEFFKEFVEFLEGNRDLAGHMIFEFAQSDFARWSDAGQRLLERLSFLGCRFSLDQVHDMNLDPAALEARHISFVKVEAERLLAVVRDNLSILRALRRHGIDLIVEKVEDEAGLIELLDYEIDFGQGYLFGEPRLARPA